MDGGRAVGHEGAGRAVTSLSSSRRAALTLHALPAPDREWVLRQLDPHHRQVLNSHLQELEALGIVADARLVSDALRSVASPSVIPQWRRSLACQSADAVHACLQAEPPALIARVLAGGPWVWESGLLERLSPEQRARVEACRHDGLAACPALDDWILCELCERLGETEVVESPPRAAEPPRGAWGALVARIKEAR